MSPFANRLSRVAMLMVVAVACNDSTAPTVSPTQFGEPLSLAQFESEVNGAARIEIEFTTPAGPVAREIEVEPVDAEEKITSRVTAISSAAGTLTLELGGIVISYDNSTRFRTLTNSNVSRASWESSIQSELTAGRNPWIEARRDQPASPQAPTSASFTAEDLRLADDGEKAAIEVYVDADNFEDVASPPTLAILRVFNLPVQIASSTRIQRILNGAPTAGVVQFEGQVVAVNPAGGTMTLADGTVIQVGSGATFDAEGDVLTLSGTATEVSSGEFVRAEGVGTIQSAGPPVTIAATSVKVEVDD